MAMFFVMTLIVVPVGASGGVVVRYAGHDT